MITYIDVIPQQDKYETALLIKPAGLKEKELKHHYIDPHNLTNLIAFGLEQGTSKKPSNKLMREHCTEMLPMLQDLGVTYLLVADANYFKLLTGKTSVADTYGYMFDCNLKEFPNFKVVYVVNYAGLFHNPALKSNLDLALSSFTKRLSGDESVLGEDIIHFEEYPETYDEIKSWLTKLHEYPELTCDLEAFSLKHWESGIGTIGFAWNKHEGIAFKVDYFECPFPSEETGYGYQSKNVPVYKLLIDFFNNYKGKLIYHNCTFDIKILIYNLYMDHLLDQKGLLKGLHTLHRDVEDTKLIKYLATNTCALNPLDLKSSAHEYTGKYAQEDINDIRKIPAKELLRYNLIDCLATWYVKEKFTPIMQADKQEKPYRELFLPSAKVINQMQLTGMCLSMPKVLDAEQKLIQDKEDFLSVIMNHPLLAKAVYNLRKRKWEKDYEDRKSKAKNPDKIKWKNFDDIKVEFNPNSGTQLIELLYHQIGLPVIDFTKTKLPATGGDTLKKLIKHTSDPEVISLLKALGSYSKAEKILTSFIPVFKAAPKGADGYHYLFGNLNLGGTKSGRLSSCLIGETKVQCAEGTRRLDEIKVGTLVPTHTGALQPVLNVFDNEEQPVYKITLQDGKQLTCTSNHRLLTETGFLSLEDLFNENETKIRRRVTRRHESSLTGLPRLAVEQAEIRGKGAQFKSSNSLPQPSDTRGAPKEKNPLKEDTNCRETGCGITPRLRYIRKRCIERYRRNSQESNSKCRYFKQVYSRTVRGCGIPKNILLKTLLPENTIKPKNKGGFTRYFERKIHRPERICISTYTSVDEKNQQVFLRASDSNAKSVGIGGVTTRMGSTPYKRGQNRQQVSKFSSYDSSRAYYPPSRLYAPIVQIDYVGVRRVYDMEVAKDHCYIANGIYVHNSDPNLQNLPSGSTYGKLIKACFVAPDGNVFWGSDFNSLESVINTLLTKDPEKEKILIDKYDSHSFNTYYYWPDEFPHIDPNCVLSVNSIKKEDHPLRGASKPVSFSLQYFGSHHTLMNNSGFEEAEAKAIEANYHNLYHVSMKWADDKIKLASKTGYAELAFGVRLRAPVLNQVVLGIKRTPTEASAEYRTLGNAISGQSYGLLNNRAVNEFMERVWASPYALTIKPSNLIHDAIYGYSPEDIDQIHWINENLIDCMAWQDLPELKHDQIKIGSEMDLFYPSWANAITLPNNSTKDEIVTICKDAMASYEEK